MKLFKRIAMTTGLFAFNVEAFAHAGHHGEGLNASLLHSFSGSELFFIMAFIVSAAVVANKISK